MTPLGGKRLLMSEQRDDVDPDVTVYHGDARGERGPLSERERGLVEGLIAHEGPMSAQARASLQEWTRQLLGLLDWHEAWPSGEEVGVRFSVFGEAVPAGSKTSYGAARPMGMVGLPGLLQRLREAWRVLRGRADIVVWEQQ